MRSSLISAGLLKSYIGRHIPLWVAFAAAWLVALVLPLGILAPSASIEYEYSQFYAGWSAEYIGSLVGAAIAGIASVVCVFDYAFSRDAALFSGALPVSRTKLFATSYVAGLLPLVTIELAVFVIITAMSVAIPAIGTTYCLAWLALTVGFTFVFYSIAAFCAMLTGTKTAAYYLYLLVMAFVPLLELVLRGIASSCTWGVELLGPAPSLLWTSPLFGMGYYTLAPHGDMWSTVSQINWLALAAYVAVAAVLVACSLLLNKRRNLERAGNAITFAGLAIAAKVVTGVATAALMLVVTAFCMSFSGGSLGGVLGYGQRVVLAAMGFIGGFLGVFFGEGLVGSGGAGILKRSWKPALCVGVVCVAFVAGCSLDVAHIKGYVPKASEVSSVTVEINGYKTKLQEEENIEAAVQEHSELLEYEDLASEDYCDRISLTYKLKDGRKVLRDYGIYLGGSDVRDQMVDSSRVKAANKVYSSLCKLCDSDEGINERLSFVYDDGSYKPLEIDITYGDDKTVSVVGSKKKDSFVEHALAKDVAGSDLGKIYEVSDSSYVGSVYISGSKGKGDYKEIELDLTEDNCPNIAKWIKANYGVDILK